MNPDNNYDQKPESSDSQPPIEEIYSRPVRRGPVVLVYLIGAAIVAVLLVFGIRWMFHALSGDNKDTNTPGAGNKVPASPEKKHNSKNKTSKSSKPSTKNSNELANTGPGSVLGVFVASSIAAGGLHYIISVRKQR
jgi:uncharacterized membrane protein YraQ (UPF0718 family)